MNPELAPCRGCGNPISRQASKCPHCGHPGERHSPAAAAIAIVALGILGLTFIGVVGANLAERWSKPSSETAPPPKAVKAPKPTPTPAQTQSHEAGFAVGVKLGSDHARDGHDLPSTLWKIAEVQSSKHPSEAPSSWEAGFVQGFRKGWEGVRRGEVEATSPPGFP